MKGIKRFVAMMLTLLMVITMLPTQVKAAEKIWDYADAENWPNPAIVSAGDIIKCDVEGINSIAIIAMCGEDMMADVLFEGETSHTVQAEYQGQTSNVKISTATTWTIADVFEADGILIFYMMANEGSYEIHYSEAAKKLIAKLEGIIETYVVDGVVADKDLPVVAKTVMDVCMSMTSEELYMQVTPTLMETMDVLSTPLYTYAMNEYTAISNLDMSTVSKEAAEAAVEKYIWLEEFKYFCEEFWTEDQYSNIYNAGLPAQNLKDPLAKYLAQEILTWNWTEITYDNLPEVAGKVGEVQHQIEYYEDYRFSVEDALHENYSEAYEKCQGYLEILEADFAGTYIIENPEDVMVYRYLPKWKSFDVHGLFNDNYLMTTYYNLGFTTYLSIADQMMLVEANKTGVAVEDSNVNVAIVLTPYNNGKAIQISYIVKNEGNQEVTYSLATGSDVQIGGDDGATIEMFEDGSGFKMISTEEYDKDTEGRFPQFNFFGKNRKGVVNVDGFWYGNYSAWKENAFNTVTDTILEGQDSGAVWHWADRKLAPGQTETLSVLIGISAEGQEAESGGDVVEGPTDEEIIQIAKEAVLENIDSVEVDKNTTADELKAAIEAIVAEVVEEDITVEVKNLVKDTTEGELTATVVLSLGGASAEVPLAFEIEKEVVDVHTHSYGWIITKEATETEEGVMTGICTCGDKITKVIPVKAGDNGSGDVTVEASDTNDYTGTLSNEADVANKVILTEEEHAAILDGDELLITLTVEDVKDSIKSEDKAAIESKLEDKTLGTYLDINLLKQVGENEPEKIKQLNGKIKISFVVPEALRGEAGKRTYTILRLHDGVVDTIVPVFDEATNTLTFETDRFSTYALAYEDADVVTPPAPPATGDAASIAPFIMLLGLGFVLVAFAAKRREVL